MQDIGDIIECMISFFAPDIPMTTPTTTHQYEHHIHICDVTVAEAHRHHDDRYTPSKYHYVAGICYVICFPSKTDSNPGAV